MTLTTMPVRLIAGDALDLSFAGAAASYPAADGYAVALTLAPIAGGTPIVQSATGGSSSWDILLPSSSTSSMGPGAYRWLLAATLGGNRTTIELGTIEVLANPATEDLDQRSPAHRALDAIDAVLEGRAAKSSIKFVFEDGRSIEHMAHSELLKLRDHYARRVAAEERGRRGPVRVQVRL